MIRALILSRSDFSPLTRTLLVRSSATIFTGAPAPSAAWPWLREFTVRTSSVALAFFSWMISTGSSPLSSMRWMIFMMRLTLLARSEMMSMLPLG